MLNQPFRGIVCFQGLNRHFVSRFFNMPLSFGPRRRGLTLSEHDILYFFKWEDFSTFADFGPSATPSHRRRLWGENPITAYARDGFERAGGYPG
jgi:hypothetical protein